MTGRTPAREPRDDVSALILAAGKGERFGMPKAYVEFGGRSLIEHVVAEVRPFAAEVIVGLPDGSPPPSMALRRDRDTIWMTGGATRQDTVARLLAAARRPYVLLHEVARPLAPRDLLAAVVEAAKVYGAAVPFLPASTRDSVAMADDNEFLGAPLRRDRVVRLQTPQAFRTELLVEVMRRARCEGWEETSISFLFAKAGHPVKLVPGSPRNKKLTYPEDGDLLREMPSGGLAKSPLEVS